MVERWKVGVGGGGIRRWGWGWASAGASSYRAVVAVLRSGFSLSSWSLSQLGSGRGSTVGLMGLASGVSGGGWRGGRPGRFPPAFGSPPCPPLFSSTAKRDVGAGATGLSRKRRPRAGFGGGGGTDGAVADGLASVICFTFPAFDFPFPFPVVDFLPVKIVVRVADASYSGFPSAVGGLSVG